jgi:hypothetical protein
MKKRGLILFNIIFFLAVLINLRTEAHSDFNSQVYTIRTSSGENDVEDNFSSENDSPNYDQIDQSCCFGLIRQPVGQILIPLSCSAVKKITISVWQPPKIS